MAGKKISKFRIEYPDETHEDAEIYLPISQVEGLQSQLDELKTQIENVENVDNLELQISNLDSRLDKVEQQIEKLECTQLSWVIVSATAKSEEN